MFFRFRKRNELKTLEEATNSIKNLLLRRPWQISKLGESVVLKRNDGRISILYLEERGEFYVSIGAAGVKGGVLIYDSLGELVEKVKGFVLDSYESIPYNPKSSDLTYSGQEQDYNSSRKQAGSV